MSEGSIKNKIFFLTIISYAKLYRVKIIVFKGRNALLLRNCCVCEQAPGSPCTVQQQHSGDGQHPWWEEPSRGLYHRRWPHRSPQVKTDMTLCYVIFAIIFPICLFCTFIISLDTEGWSVTTTSQWTHPHRITFCPSVGPTTQSPLATAITLAWRCLMTYWRALRLASDTLCFWGKLDWKDWICYFKMIWGHIS